MPQKGKRACGWCNKLLATDNTTHVVYCSKGCHDADKLFQYHNSDVEINRKRHYKRLTRGQNNET